MSLKIPATEFATDVTGDTVVEQRGLREKEGWQWDRSVVGHPTASILRYTESGGIAYAHVAPTLTQVTGLADLPVMHYDGETLNLERKYGALFETGQRVFVFYNVEVEPKDVIAFGGKHWRPVGGTIDYDDETGKCEVLAQLTDPTP